MHRCSAPIAFLSFVPRPNLVQIGLDVKIIK
ncbi:MAG: hypothetical protein ACI8W3_003659 [Myxococcota bacterium]